MLAGDTQRVEMREERWRESEGEREALMIGFTPTGDSRLQFGLRTAQITTTKKAGGFSSVSTTPSLMQHARTA